MKITRNNFWTGVKALLRNAWNITFLKSLAAHVLAFSKVFDMERYSSLRPLALTDKKLELGTPFFLSYEETKGATTLLEQYVLLSLVRAHRVSSFFEFGTFQGQTSFVLAKNFPDLSIATLDLPAIDIDKTEIPISSGERRYVQKPVVGAKFLGTLEQQRIIQLLGDSATFDYTPYHGTMDCIFVDGCHDYAYIKNDTEHALRLLKEKGIILWHDYLTYESVTHYLSELGRELPLYHIQHTSLVLYCRGGEL